LVALVWGLNGASELEAGHHLVKATTLQEAAISLKFDNEKSEKLFASARLKMLNLRSHRNLPKDRKILAGWNGLVLSALTQAVKTYNNDKYAEAARDLKKYLYKNMWRQNELLLGVNKNKSLGPGELKDYAYVIQGLSGWLELEPDEQDRAWLKSLIETAWGQFYTKNGWALSKNALLKYKQNTTIIVDDVLPSTSAILITSTFKNTQAPRLMSLAREALTLTQSELLEQPFWYASHIFAVDTYLKKN
jgi:uncharacterized protein YyaL (SSP411 family)